jgi:hypothetical protein
VDLDERPHTPPDGEPGWEESWTFDVVADGGALGLFVRFGLRAAGPGAAFQAALVRSGEPVVLVVDDDLPPPRGSTLELRAEGLWCALELETPLEHWTVGLEAFGVAVEDPAEVRGDRTALGTDLEWETTGAVEPWAGGYSVPCRVSGELLVGRETLTIDAPGRRRHDWGVPAWTDLVPAGEPVLAMIPLPVRSPTATRLLWPGGWAETG